MYTVRSGDTLQGIAAALYGDGNLWYRLAEANGLSGNTALSEGQSLLHLTFPLTQPQTPAKGAPSLGRVG
jgi:nucleoid-associated protein YgaU